MKRTIIILNLTLSFLGFSQVTEEGVTSTDSASGNHAFVGTYSNSVFSNWLGTGDSATNYNLLGYSSKYAGFGVASGGGIVSPIIWMYANAKNAFRVRTMNYNGDITTGKDLFTVRANGYIGIGITDPTSILDIKTINYSGNQEGGINLSAFYNNINRWTAQVGLKSNSGGSPRFAITTKNRDASNVETANNEALSIKLYSGYVGIGSSEPNSILQIGENANTVNLFEADGISSDVSFNGTNTSGDIWSFINSEIGVGTRFYVEDANNSPSRLTFDFKGNAGATNILSGTSNGNVGIGTTTPEAKLDIFGQVDGDFNGLIIDNRKTYGVNSGVNETSRILLSLSENGSRNTFRNRFE